MKIITKTLIMFALVTGLAQATSFKPGKWVITGYSEIAGFFSPVDQTICVVETVKGKSGTFYGITFPWAGNWFQKGNDIHINSLYANGFYASSFELTRIDSGLLTGYWQDFNDSTFTNYLTAKAVFKSAKCDPAYISTFKGAIANKAASEK